MIMQFLETGAARYTGLANAYSDFVERHQLLNERTWRSFVEVFRHDSDDADRGWRCEYWGKMMRGATLTYRYGKNEELYRVLTDTVCDLLTTERADGRFSTYSKDAQLSGWDLWGRKYVLTGMLHYYRICRDERLKARILAAMCHHADAILATVGDGDGMTPITATSNYWGCVNSCSILDAMLDLYHTSGEKRYLDFASYIVRTGGCSDGNLIDLAIANKLAPCEYPEVKAYETISFFEGVLSYYQATGEERYFMAVRNFTEAVAATDITVIGCAGCTHELFDRSAVRQTEYSDGIMQETCVTVTWMRMLARLYLVTGDAVYMERMERSAYNALYGSVNTECQKQLDRSGNVYLDPLPFDSYSPLRNQVRGRGIGGLKHFASGGHYGCCACIASAGTALFPLTAVMRREDGFAFNGYLDGEIVTATADGTPVTFCVKSRYPAVLDADISVRTSGDAAFTVALRVPDFCSDVCVSLNGKKTEAEAENGYILFSRTWQDGDRLVLSAHYALEEQRINESTVFFWGPLTLARDAEKEEGQTDLEEKLSLVRDGEKPLYTVEPTVGREECVRLSVQAKDSENVNKTLLLTNYSSCGKRWIDKKRRMTVFMNIE